ncbi:MAG TPA: hypothetical protein VGE11_05030 [Pseudonocardia sp.]
MTTTTYTSDTVRLPRPTSEPTAAGRPVLDAARLWTGGLATALVAALIGLVGVLVVRVLATHVPQLAVAGVLGTSSGTVLLCTTAAGAALVATGFAHLLLMSTPRPMAYLGWIVGLATAAAAVLPLTTGVPITTALAEGLVNLVIGLAIGSLVAGAAYSASRGTCER